jgi:hypothetical protein
MLEKRFGHLRSSTVSGAKEEHAWSPPPWMFIHGPRLDHLDAQAGLERRSDPAEQVGAPAHIHAVIGVAPVR